MLRSYAFNVLFYVWTVCCAIAYLPALLLPRGVIIVLIRYWAKGALGLLRWVVGTRCEIRGAHHMPEGAALIAAKHQSAWDTIIYFALFDNAAMVLKRELMSIPVYGWYIRKSGMIPIDRQAGARALRTMLPLARTALGENRQVIIFPEGTRVAPDVHQPYRPGIAGLYKALGRPVIPVAVNSGVFWPRRQMRRRPGVIVLEFLPPIQPGLSRDDFMAALEGAVENASAALVHEADPTIELAWPPAGESSLDTRESDIHTAAEEPVDKTVLPHGGNRG